MMMFSQAEKEQCRQVLVTCYRCRRLFPVDVLYEGDRLVIQPGPIVYDPQDGFICQSCSGPDPLDLGTDEPRQSPDEIREQIIDLLFIERAGMTVSEIDDILGIGHSSAAYYLKGMMKDGRVKREKAPDGKGDIYIYIE